jgi:hypothetical protein
MSGFAQMRAYGAGCETEDRRPCSSQSVRVCGVHCVRFGSREHAARGLLNSGAGDVGALDSVSSGPADTVGAFPSMVGPEANARLFDALDLLDEPTGRGT